jgi:hypothetical protein
LSHLEEKSGDPIDSAEQRWRFGMCCLMMNDILSPDLDEKVDNEEKRTAVLEGIVRGNYFEKEDRFANGFVRSHEFFVELPRKLRSHPQFYDFPSRFHEMTGLTIQDYLALGFAVKSWWADVTLENIGKAAARIYLNPIAFFSPCKADPGKFKPIFDLLAITPDVARDELATEKASLKESWQVRFSNLTLEKRPLLNTPDGILCASLRFLDWKFTRNMFHTISNNLPAPDTKAYRDFFGRIFEEYVRSLLVRCFHKRCVMEHYGASHQEAGEAVIVYPRALIIVEAKSSRLSLEVNRSGDMSGFRKAVRDTVIAGTKQIDRVISDFASGLFRIENVKSYDIGRIYPVIVTAESMPQEFFTRTELDKMLEEARVFQDPVVAPLTLLSIDELEILEPLLNITTMVEILGGKNGNQGNKDISMKNYVYLQYGTIPENEAIKERLFEIAEYIDTLLNLESQT